MTEKNLKNKDYIFTLLTALIKKAGGEIRISESEMHAVTKTDVVTMLWDQSSQSVVLQTSGFLLPLGGAMGNEGDSGIN
jgi:hypothetical protein